MRMHSWILRSAPLAAIMAATAATAVHAQGSELFEWTGQVDREVQVVMRNGQVWTNNVGQTERPRARTREFGNLPRQDGQVSVQLLNGRGNVDVIQQPSRQNNYTTIVRITDPRGGSDTYRLAAYWQGYANGDVYSQSGRNRNRERDREVYRDRDRDNNNSQGDRGIYNGNGANGNGVYNDRVYNRGNQELLHWSGNVDGELEIRIQQNGEIQYRNLSGNQPTNVRANAGYANMRNGGTIAVTQNQGRGSVVVIQQPSQWNNYTTVLRVRDPQGGYGYYDFSLFRQ